MLRPSNGNADDAGSATMPSSAGAEPLVVGDSVRVATGAAAWPPVVQPSRAAIAVPAAAMVLVCTMDFLNIRPLPS